MIKLNNSIFNVVNDHIQLLLFEDIGNNRFYRTN